MLCRLSFCSCSSFLYLCRLSLLSVQPGAYSVYSKLLLLLWEMWKESLSVDIFLEKATGKQVSRTANVRALMAWWIYIGDKWSAACQRIELPHFLSTNLMKRPKQTTCHLISHCFYIPSLAFSYKIMCSYWIVFKNSTETYCFIFIQTSFMARAVGSVSLFFCHHFDQDWNISIPVGHIAMKSGT